VKSGCWKTLMFLVDFS